MLKASSNIQVSYTLLHDYISRWVVGLVVHLVTAMYLHREGTNPVKG